MTVPLDFPTNFTFGSIVAMSAGARLKGDTSNESTRLVARQAAWLSAWFGICVAYEYMTYPDWMWAYFTDTAGMKQQVILPLFWLGLVLSGVLGARWTAKYLREGRWRGARWVGLAGLFATIGTFWATYNEYMFVGTHAQFERVHKANLLHHAGLQAATPWTIGLVAVPGVLLVLTNLVRGKKA